MQPKADMVSKESGFNQSETACGLRVRIAWRFPCSPAMARDGELIQAQYFCHHWDTISHPKSSYVTTKLYETSACGCRGLIRFFRKRYFHVSYRWRMPGTLAWQRTSLGDAAKVARWRHCWIHHFSCLKFRFCVGLTTVSNIMINWCTGMHRWTLPEC